MLKIFIYLTCVFKTIVWNGHFMVSRVYFLIVAEMGGVVGSCADLSCYFGAVCTERTGGALCECTAAACPDSDTNMLVSVFSVWNRTS